LSREGVEETERHGGTRTFSIVARCCARP
jgi:hypothetical protein